MHDVIVIGGGASGMTAAVCAARKHKRVLLIEKGNKLGRKISASGNGKCNLTNAEINSSFYHDAYKNELDSILNRCDRDAVLSFMKSIGIRCKEKRGCYYPMSEQAAVVVQMFQAELEHLQVRILLEERVTDIVWESNGDFSVVTEKGKYRARKVVLSSGGMAAPKLGAEATGYHILKRFGHTVKTMYPALVQLTTKERYVKKVSGVRTEAKICLKIQGLKYFEEGEIIFTDTGISGIPVFQLSRYVAEAIDRREEVVLSVNVLPACNKNELKTDICELIHYNPELPVEYLFRSVCNHKLVFALLQEAGYNAEMPCKKLTDSDIDKLIRLFYDIELHINGTNGFEQAQVTKGGVPLDEVNTDTMESKLISGLYITGELLDIDGICGGYNLHFAWASGMLAGNSAVV